LENVEHEERPEEVLRDGVMMKSEEPAAVLDVGLEPPIPEYIMDMPNITTIDLCVFTFAPVYVVY
jgi:splicing factor 3A subunit 1